jgi:hypothetical protein
VVIGLATLTFVPAVLGALAYLLVPPIPDEVQLPPLRWVFAHYLQVAFAQALFAVPVFIAGVGLLRRAPWARRATQLLMVMWAALMLAFGIWMASWFPRASASGAGALFRAVALGSALQLAVPAALAVWLAERKAAREWFKTP